MVSTHEVGVNRVADTGLTFTRWEVHVCPTKDHINSRAPYRTNTVSQEIVTKMATFPVFRAVFLMAGNGMQK